MDIPVDTYDMLSAVLLAFGSQLRKSDNIRFWSALALEKDKLEGISETGS